MKEIPIWEKSNLSLEEAAAYSGIGINKLREITNEDRCKFVLWVGNKRLIKRRLFDHSNWGIHVNIFSLTQPTGQPAASKILRQCPQES